MELGCIHTEVHPLVTLASMKNAGLRITMQNRRPSRYRLGGRGKDKRPAQLLHKFRQAHADGHVELQASLLQ